jgi:2-polyprenyl-6-methoxyphenol hydroxylase-like FAD-dependent oxidoreductase
VQLRGVHLLVRGKVMAYLPFENPANDFPPFTSPLSLPQSDTEQLLLQSLNAQGKAVEWESNFVGLTQSDQGVVATVQRADGSKEEITALWLIGCDGGRSSVRHALEIAFPGSTYEQTAFLADVALKPPYAPDILNLNLSNFGFVGIGPFSAERFRLFGALSPAYAAKFGAQNEGQAVSGDDIQQWFREYFYLPNTITRVDWTAIYRIHCRLAERFQVGRCFLVGDAAHIHAPAGGQGMNLGVGDAFNLGWKLALTIRGEANPMLLQSYEEERRPVARAVINGADRGFELEATTNPLVEAFRIHLLPHLINLGSRMGVVRRIINQLFSQNWIAYHRSPIVATTTAQTSLKGGDRAPNGFLKSDGQHLFDLLQGVDHHLLLFEGIDEDGAATQLEQALSELLTSYKVKVIIYRIPSDNTALQRRYGVKNATFFLIRPDGHIAYIGDARHLASFRAYMDQLYTQVAV